VSEPHPPPSAPAALKVANRSDRVWVYGYLRLVPAVLWVGGLVLFVLAVEYIRPHPIPALCVFALILVGPLALDRSTLLDPVNYVVFGPAGLLVQRLAGKRSFWQDELLRVEVVRPEGEDYDEKQRARRFAELTLRFRRRRRARLLATHADAVRVAEWAAVRNIPVVERPD
jgi:hypothetical protein